MILLLLLVSLQSKKTESLQQLSRAVLPDYISYMIFKSVSFHNCVLLQTVFSNGMGKRSLSARSERERKEDAGIKKIIKNTFKNERK